MSILAVVPVHLRDDLDAELLARCLVSLHITAPGLDVLVVDDGSPATHLVDQLGAVTDELGQRLFLEKERRGFAKTVNVGLRAALEEGRDALLVSQGLQFVESGGIEAMLACPDAAGRPAAVVGARLLYPSGLIQHGGMFHSRFYGWYDHRFRYGPADLPEANVRHTCPVTAALQLIRHDALERVGFYDETSAMGPDDDVEYCLRAFDAGLACVYEPAAWAYHHERAVRGRLEGPSPSGRDSSGERHAAANGGRRHAAHQLPLR